MKNVELTELYRARRFWLPDGRSMTVSHVNPFDDDGLYFRVIYDLNPPDSGRGWCWLDTLQGLVEITDYAKGAV